jgi:carboxyl-terminal processing protease
MQTRFPVPQLSWIKQGILGSGCVWLNVGWHKYNPSKGEYKRISGHWVTLVGYGKDENGRVNPKVLIIHDPSPRAGKGFSSEYATVSRIRSGTLVGEWIGLPRRAAGYYKLGGGMHVKKSADFAVIDGVIALKLKPTIAGDRIKKPGTGKGTSGTGDPRLNAQQAKQSLTNARSMLKGKNKDIRQTREVLLDLAENHALLLTSTDRCYVYVYLGYVEDLAGQREAAIGWYKKAVTLEGPNIKGIREVAKLGVTKPITRIRHLDAESRPAKSPAWEKAIIGRIGKGLVTTEQPGDDILPRMNLSKAERLENFDILWEAIDRNYSFFVHKGIDWQEVKSRYRPRVERVKTTKDFYRLMHQFVMELRDFHSWLCNYKDVPTLGRFSPQMSTRLIEGKAVVTDVVEGSEAYEEGLRPGAVITGVDGLSVKAKAEKIRPLMHVYSSQRCFLERAYRRILDGEKGTKVSVKFLAPGENSLRTARLKRGGSKRGEAIQPDFRVNKGKFIWYGIHPSGYGYVRILSFKGREEIADEFDRALERLKDTPGLIIDIRENPGGFGTAQARIIGRFIRSKTKVDIAYTKSGPGHKDFKKHEAYFVPTGGWQYTKPIAMLMNAITGSACDLFACRMISTGRPVTVGTTTHGNLTGRCVYVVLPCNLVVRVSNGYVCEASGRIIEGNGNVPRIHAERTIDDVVNGTDSVLERAVQSLRRTRD